MPITAKHVTDFPEPDSPTRPTVFPFGMSKEIFLTARTVPSLVGNSTLRFLMLSNDSIFSLLLLRPVVGVKVHSQLILFASSGNQINGALSVITSLLPYSSFVGFHPFRFQVMDVPANGTQ